MHFAEAIYSYSRGYMQFTEAICDFAEAICSFCENMGQLSPVEAGVGTKLDNKNQHFLTEIVKLHKLML